MCSYERCLNKKAVHTKTRKVYIWLLIPRARELWHLWEIQSLTGSSAHVPCAPLKSPVWGIKLFDINRKALRSSEWTETNLTNECFVRWAVYDLLAKWGRTIQSISFEFHLFLASYKIRSPLIVIVWRWLECFEAPFLFSPFSLLYLSSWWFTIFCNICAGSLSIILTTFTCYKLENEVGCVCAHGHVQRG